MEAACIPAADESVKTMTSLIRAVTKVNEVTTVGQFAKNTKETERASAALPLPS